jgi:hypothetical protein
LKYGRLDKANVKYSEVHYNEKRLWICRLLAQLLLEDVIIISVDESNFRSEALPHLHWHFNMVLGKRKMRKYYKLMPLRKRKYPEVLHANDRQVIIGDRLNWYRNDLHESQELADTDKNNLEHET